MSEQTDTDIARRLTGLCTYLVQGPEFEAGDEVRLTMKYDPGSDGVGWLPLTAVPADERRDELGPAETEWGRDVVLVGATLAATGGQPRDSMNQPADEYDPEAVTLSDVRVLDRSRSGLA